VEDKKMVFQNLSNLKDKPAYKAVHISDDYTYNERQLIQDFSQKARLKTAEEANPNIIYRVRGSPKNGLFIKKFMKVPQTPTQ